MSWQCLLEGELKQRAIETADEIIAAIAARPDGTGALDGAGGHACLMVYAVHAGRDEALAERAAAMLDAMVTGVSEGGGRGALWGGLAGARFTVAHLAGGDEAGEALLAMDAALLTMLAVPAWDQDYDLIGGLCGFGVAALEGGGEAERIAVRVLDHLEATARHEPEGTAWYTAPELLPEWQRAVCPDGYFNLGLAHGIPGVIGFLAKLLDAGVEVERARVLLEGAVRWMLTVAPAREGGRFPAWRGRGANDEPSRLAWCYGDPGVAVPLLAAARATRNDLWEAQAMEIAHGMAARPMATSGVADMGICHGAAGVAHIFNRLYQATGDEVLGDAARAWIEQLLAMRRPGEAVAGFPSMTREEGRDIWQEDAGLLMGATGVGLVLLAATSEIEPAWDRALLCEIAPPADAQP